MNLIGYEVLHKTFGRGVILGISGNHIRVQFPGVEKTFVYPDAFNGFMQVVDAAAAEVVAADLVGALALRGKAARDKAEERERQMRSGIVIPGGKMPAEREDLYTARDEDEDE